MNLAELIETYRRLVTIAASVGNKNDARKMANDAKDVTKAIKKIKDIDLQKALQIVDLFRWQRNEFDAIIIQSDPAFISELAHLFTPIREFEKMREKNPELFMDAEAMRVGENLGFHPTNEIDIVSFKAILQGMPVPRRWTLTLDQTRKSYEIDLPVFRFEGLGKISSDLFYIDWIGGKKSEEARYWFGPRAENQPLAVFPFSLLTEVNVPSKESWYDFDFQVTMPTDVSRDHLRKVWKKNINYDYHAIPLFEMNVRIEGLKGDSKDDLRNKKTKIIQTFQNNIQEDPQDIGWEFVYLRLLGANFPPAFRGKISLQDAPSPYPPIPTESGQTSFEDYRATILEKFDEDNVRAKEGTIDEIGVIWGTKVILGDMVALTGFPPTPGRIDVSTICVGFVGLVDHISKEFIESFTKSSITFAKDKIRGRPIAFIPVLAANDIDPSAKSWVESTADTVWDGMIVPAILDLENGDLYFRRNAPFSGRVNYQHARAFIERYLITDEMRWRKAATQKS